MKICRLGHRSVQDIMIDLKQDTQAFLLILPSQQIGFNIQAQTVHGG